MVETYHDREIREELERLRKEEEKKKYSWWGSLPTKTKAIFVGLVIFILYWIWKGQQTDVSNKGLPANTGIIILILVAVGIYFIAGKDTSQESHEGLSHRELMALLKQQLEEMQTLPLTYGRTQLPKGEIQIDPYFNTPTSNDVPTKKQTSVTIIRPNGQRMWFRAVQSATTGNLLDLQRERTPFVATDKKLHKVIRIPPKLVEYKTIEDYMKKLK